MLLNFSASRSYYGNAAIESERSISYTPLHSTYNAFQFNIGSNVHAYRVYVQEPTSRHQWNIDKENVFLFARFRRIACAGFSSLSLIHIIQLQTESIQMLELPERYKDKLNKIK